MVKTINYDNYTLNMYKTDLFKSTRIHISFGSPFQENRVTERAILPYMMKAGSTKYPERKDVVTYLENLYSTYFTASVEKIGLTHIVYFDLSLIDDHYTLDNEPLFQEGLDFLKEMIMNPLLSEKSFTEEFRLMDEYFKGIYSNKGAYSMKLLKDVMFEKEVYKTSSLGSAEFLQDITLESVKKAYASMINNDNITITVVGNIDPEYVEKAIKDTFNFSSRKTTLEYIDYDTKDIQEVNNITEVQKVTQAKYSLGYRLPVYYDDPLYYPAAVFATLLGGTSESLLHLTVREKLGLCYYIGASYDSHKGVLFIQSGIDASKQVTVLEETNKIIDSLINMTYDEMLLDMAIKANVNSVLESKDSNSSLAMRLERLSFYNKELDFEGKINSFLNVTKEQVSEVAKLLQLDTTCLLRGEN